MLLRSLPMDINTAMSWIINRESCWGVGHRYIKESCWSMWLGYLRRIYPLLITSLFRSIWCISLNHQIARIVPGMNIEPMNTNKCRLKTETFECFCNYPFRNMTRSLIRFFDTCSWFQLFSTSISPLSNFKHPLLLELIHFSFCQTKCQWLCRGTFCQFGERYQRVINLCWWTLLLSVEKDLNGWYRIKYWYKKLDKEMSTLMEQKVYVSLLAPPISQRHSRISIVGILPIQNPE